MKMFKETKPTKYLIVLNIGYVTDNDGPEVLTEFYAKNRSGLTLKFAKFLGENFEDIYFYCRDKGINDADIHLVEVEEGDTGRIIFGYRVNLWD